VNGERHVGLHVLRAAAAAAGFVGLASLG
jgi:hypothetical protein